MRRRTLRGIVLGGIAVCFAAAAVLGYVSRGEAAGSSICPPNSDSSPSCLAAAVSPHTLKQGFAALASGRFDDRATSTATHVALSILFSNGQGNPLPVSIAVDSNTQQPKITVIVNGSSVAKNCSPSTGATFASTTSITCSVGNLSGGSYAKLLVPFTPSSIAPAQVVANTAVTYGEGSDAGNPKQSGSMYSALVFPNSRRKYWPP